MNLMGDPEMKVWVGKQKSWLVEIAKQIDVHRPLVVKVLEEEPHPPRPVPEALVHVVGGDVELLAHTDEQGEARFDLSSLPRGDVHVTVSGEEAVPVLETVRLVGPEWLTGTIEQISHEERPGGTLVEVAPEAQRGRRRCWAATGARDYGVLLDALTDA